LDCIGGGVGFGVPDCKSHVCTLQVSPTEIRGALGSVNQLAICVGILLALIAGLPLVNNPAWYSNPMTSTQFVNTT